MKKFRKYKSLEQNKTDKLGCAPVDMLVIPSIDGFAQYGKVVVLNDKDYITKINPKTPSQYT